MATAGFTKKGRDKPNQDEVLSMSLEGKVLLAIADGMGGKIGGKEASTAVIESISEAFRRFPAITISGLFREAHEALIKKSLNDSALFEMGTTLSICLVEEDEVTVGHVGDTRVYHLKNNGLLTKTKDQTEMQHLLDEGILSKRKAKNYNRKNILLSVLTPSDDHEIFSDSFKIAKADRLLLCSDGFYSLVSKLETRDASVNSETIESLSEKLLGLVESRDIHDDYSLLIYQH